MALSPHVRLPIHEVLAAIREAVEQSPVVVSASTGSGKSTEVPRAVPRPVFVVEPRRIACRSLAQRVADLEGTTVGAKVGYWIRDEQRTSAKTEITFLTPGMALRNLDRLLTQGTFILDELHERTLDIDLLLAIARERAPRLVVMSATLDGARVAKYVRGRLIEAEGRLYPVAIGYDEKGPTVPTADRLTERVVAAIRGSSEEDTLVFLPGKFEINKTAQALAKAVPQEVIPLHSGLSAQAQQRAFAPSKRTKIILATNVAETSITVPGITKVVDSGLVRQMRYHRGRGSLTLSAIARDSADQRAGRAGRTSPGRCIRLWREHAHLEAATPPEVHRMSLIPLVLATRAHGLDPQELEWLDAPKEHGLEAAHEDLLALGALDSKGQLSERGQRIFQMPVDPWVGRFLVEAEERNLLDDAIDLAAGLELSRSAFSTDGEVEDDDPRHQGCDILAMVAAVRSRHSAIVQSVQAELQEHRQRLRRTFGRSAKAPTGPPDRDGLVHAILASDPRSARVHRSRGRSIVWGGYGQEMELDRRSSVQWAVDHTPDAHLPQALLALGVRSLREGHRQRLIITAATPVSIQQLNELGMGTLRIASVRLSQKRIYTDVERVFAGKVIGRREDQLAQGERLIEAVVTLIERNRLLKGVFAQTEDRLERWRLARRLVNAQLIRSYDGDFDQCIEDVGDASSFLRSRLINLGFVSQEDLQLIEPEDLLPPELPIHLEDAVLRDYPQRVDLGEAKYRVQYDFGSRRAVLMLESGGRHKAPPRLYLPRFPGFKVSIQAGGTMVDLG